MLQELAENIKRSNLDSKNKKSKKRNCYSQFSEKSKNLNKFIINKNKNPNKQKAPKAITES